MPEDRWQRLYREEAAVLGAIGRVLETADVPLVEVCLPRDLAAAAVAAWERDDQLFPGSLPSESFEQRVVRSRAATLAMIGLAVTDRGVWHEDHVAVALHPSWVGNAMEAADDLPA